MKIICEHCGTNINIDKDNICPNCKAPYNKNKEYIKYKEDTEKLKKEAIEYGKEIKKGINKYSKVIIIAVVSIFAIGILSFLIISINSAKLFKNIFDKGSELIDNQLINSKDDNSIDLKYSNVIFLDKMEWNGLTISKPSEGNIYVVFNINIKNNGNKDLFIFDDDIVCSINGVQQKNVSIYNREYEGLPTELKSGLSADGYITFEVPNGSTEFDLTFKNKTIHIGSN